MNEDTASLPSHSEVLRLTADIVTAYVGQNSLPTAQLAEVINAVHTALTAAGQEPAMKTEAAVLKPAVPIKKSVTPEYLVCLEDGKRLTMLKRYLRTQYGLTPDEYRAKWGLPSTYPMVAPNYAERRSAFAKQIGLGKVAPSGSPASKKSSGKRKAAA